jgi:biopolymer transport protein ExbD
MNALGDDSSDCTAKKPRVEIIPLIDVVFFLLATFVLFTLTLHRVKVQETDLPHSDLAGETDDEHTAFIQASADGTFHWRIGSRGLSETITAAELGPRLRLYKRSYLSPRVLVRSDPTAKLRAAVLILDEVHRAEITDVAIETRTTPTGS